MKYCIPILGLFLALALTVIYPTPVRGGEPGGTIGPMNPTMFKCMDKDDRISELFQPDPFNKQYYVRVTFIRGGVEIPISQLDDFLADNPDAREQTCSNEIKVDFGFDTTDAAQFEAYLDDLDRTCSKKGGKIVPITDTRIDGKVYEFHPDVNKPGEWFAVPSRSVPVMAKGITFEITWGTDDNGYFYFPNLGAGPINLNLNLPPDAHMLNANVVAFSSGLEETQSFALGFYRGDGPAPDPDKLRLPDGGALSVGNFTDIQTLARCGYTDMPNVGGVLPKEQSISTIVIMVAVLIVLPVAGLVRLRANRLEDK